MKIKSPVKLIVSILIAQSAGLVGSVFTVSAIPSWYAFLNKPSFSPPNWLFAPVWTILYTLIGISLYRMWIKKTNLKLFFFHIFLNAIWSPVFFGFKNLGLAFFVIIIMDITLLIIINNFRKIDKIAAYLLVPYFLWICFASILNYSVWRLNVKQKNIDVFAEELTTQKAFQDYLFVQDNYRDSLSTYDLKRDSYLKNPTLSTKEELRLKLFDLLSKRNDYKRAYLTVIRTRVNEAIFSKIDQEVVWYEKRKEEIGQTDALEDLLNKSKQEDLKYQTETLPIVYFALSNISLATLIELKNEHINIYEKLKNEAVDLVRLGRAKSDLFERWYKDIDFELNEISNSEKDAQVEIDKILTSDNYQIKKSYDKVAEKLLPAKQNLLQINKFIKELELAILEKR